MSSVPQMDQSAAALLASMNNSFADVRANTGEIERPPEGICQAIITGIDIKSDQIKVGDANHSGVFVTLRYSVARDQKDPSWNPSMGTHLDFPGNRIGILPGFDKLPDNQRTRFQLDGGRLKQAAAVILKRPADSCVSPGEMIQALQARLADRTNPVIVKLRNEYRTYTNAKTNKEGVQYSDFILELLAG